MRGSDFDSELVRRVERVADVLAREKAGWVAERIALHRLTPDALIITDVWTCRWGPTMTHLEPAHTGARLGQVIETRIKKRK